MTKTVQLDDEGSQDWNSSLQDQIASVQEQSSLGFTNKSTNREVKLAPLSLSYSFCAIKHMKVYPL